MKANTTSRFHTFHVSGELGWKMVRVPQGAYEPMQQSQAYEDLLTTSSISHAVANGQRGDIL